MLNAPRRWGGFILNGNRPIIVLLSLTTAAAFWSTAAVEFLALLSLAAMLLQGSSYKEQHRSRDLHTETVLQLLFWLLYFITLLISFFKAPDSAPLPLHMLWHPLLFPAVLLLGVRAGEKRVLAAVFIASGCLAALATLATIPFSMGEHLESQFVGDTTFFDLLVLATLVSVCLSLSSSRWWLFLLAGLPAAAAVVLSAQRAPVVIMLGASFLLTLAWRPRKAVAWLGIAVALLLLGPQALWMKLAWFFHGQPLDRYPVWTAGMQLIPSVPMFGYGPGSFAGLLPVGVQAAFLHRAPASWHNDLLQTTLENGWVTALAYVAMLLSVIAPAARESLRYASSTAAAHSAVMIVLLLSCLGCSALGLMVSTSVLGTVFWILLALTATTAIKDYHHAH